MSSDNVKKYYVAGLHALRSASEQGATTAPMLKDKASDSELQAIVADYGALATRHQEEIVGFLSDLGLEPNDFKDRVMEGVGNGTTEMLKAATDDIIDVGVISGASTGAQYYHNAFAAQPATAKVLDLETHVSRWSAMADEWKAIEARLAKANEAALAKSMDDASQTT